MQSKLLLFTLGYQGLDLASYLQVLIEARVSLVIDVREVPWSRKKGFSKTSLSAALESNGIKYLHIRSAGNPKANRQSAASIRECLERYETYLTDKPETLDELQRALIAAQEMGETVCLTCFERLPSECHRTLIVEKLKQRDPRFAAVDLAERQC